jgi:hypothetical protein
MFEDGLEVLPNAPLAQEAMVHHFEHYVHKNYETAIGLCLELIFLFFDLLFAVECVVPLKLAEVPVEQREHIVVELL